MNKKRKELVISVIGVLLLILSAAFCYRKRYEMQSLVMKKKVYQNMCEKMSSHSLQATLQGKSNLVYAALSGDMANEESIEASLLKVRRKGKIYPSGSGQPDCKTGKQIPAERQEEIQDTLLQDQIRKTYSGGYVLYLTKAVYMDPQHCGVCAD